MKSVIVSTSRFVVDSVIIHSGIDKYAEMMTLFNKGKGCVLESFQKTYTYFYRVRRSAEWLSSYYNLMGRIGERRDIAFSEVLRLVDEIHGSGVEFSFASKMLHTINPNMPIWDSQVKRTLGLRDISLCGEKEKREKEACQLYEELCSDFKILLKDSAIQREIEEFNKILPKYADCISDVKKLDYLLWESGR